MLFSFKQTKFTSKQPFSSVKYYRGHGGVTHLLRHCQHDGIHSTIVIPIPNEDALEHVTVKVQVATKTKIGKKIVLGCVYIHPDNENSIEHWTSMTMSHNNPVPMWYSFE
jgi:hypothetical protein